MISTNADSLMDFDALIDAYGLRGEPAMTRYKPDDFWRISPVSLRYANSRRYSGIYRGRRRRASGRIYLGDT